MGAKKEPSVNANVIRKIVKYCFKRLHRFISWVLYYYYFFYGADCYMLSHKIKFSEMNMYSIKSQRANS